MKILFSTTYYDPYVSGLSLYIKRLGTQLVKRGYDVTVLAMQHDVTTKPLERKSGVRIVRAKPWFALSKGFVSFDFIVQAWRGVRACDTVVINLPQVEGVWPALFGRMFSKNVITIYHSEVHLPQGFGNSVIQSLLEVANMATLLLSHTVVTYTDDFAKHSKLLRWVKDKVETCLPPVPQPTVKASVVARIQKQIGHRDITIGVAARLAAEKGLEYLFAAVPLLRKALRGKRIKVAIAGPDRPVGEHAYRRKIRVLEQKYKETLVFLGTLSQEEMGSFYSSLDVLVLPSVNSTETFGMVQVEAMMMGVPAVASNLPGVRIPIQKTGMGIVVTPRDSGKLAEAIVTLIKNKDSYMKKKDKVASIFSLKKTVDFYEQLFRS